MKTPSSSLVSERRTSNSRTVYPLSAIVAQEEMKLALILNVISSSIGGVLIMGHRGTGKSTVVRALADLLPEIAVVPGCAYRCDPADQQSRCEVCREDLSSGTKQRRNTSPVAVVELPLGATEDRVCGTIDIEHALRTGGKRFEPGLLARANRGFLYIDEVNLLEDHLVDILLDVAATGVNKVERESISVEHPARFVLIGSGNPEEGELRPQLLDRFGVYVEVKTEEDLDLRVEIMERREAFERDPDSFRARFADEQEQLRRKIARARKSLPNVKIERQVLQAIARLCSELRVDGHRGELTVTRAARALSAFEGRKKVTEDDVRRVVVMSLRHRLRRDALEETGGSERIEDALNRVFGETVGKPGSATRHDGGEGDDSSGNGSTGKRLRKQSSADRASATAANGRLGATPNGSHGVEAPTQPSASAVDRALPKLEFEKKIGNAPSQKTSRLQGSRESGGQRAVYGNQRGRYARSVNSKAMSDRLALDATLRAAAIAGFSVRRPAEDADLDYTRSYAIPADALRFKLFKRKQGRLFIFAIDLSGSMALTRLGHAKSSILALLRESYIKRDCVAIVGFRGVSAELLLSPSRSILRARRVLDSVGVGGGTPLSAGLARSLELSKQVGNKAGEIFLLVFTDGQANVPLKTKTNLDRLERQRQIEVEITQLGTALKKSAVTTVVISTHDRYRSNDAAQRIAAKLGARYSWHFV
jgi:magnesium chelatase subunit D